MSTPASAYETAPFIVTTPTRQSVEEKRKFIRSHAMRGKNRKKPLPRPASWINGSHIGDETSTNKENTFSISAKVGHDFSCAAIQAEVSPALLDVIWKFKRATSPPELSLISDPTRHSWLEPVLNDAACLHFTIFIAETYRDFIQGQKGNGQSALAHFVKALGILRHRLASNENEGSICDSTILVVIGLTAAANGLGDFDAALHHIRGLQQMVTLRGGILAFKTNMMLQAKILRTDLAVALSTGYKPLFFSDTISWGSYIASRRRAPISRMPRRQQDSPAPALDLGPFLDSLDIRLRLVWGDLSEFTRAANIATQCKLTIDGELYQEVMISIHYRLVNLYFDAGSMSDLIRLALLAFASSIFLQWCDVKTRYEDLSESLRDALSILSRDSSAMPTQLVLWLYIIGRVSVLGEAEQVWFRPALAGVLRSMKLKSWNEIKLVLSYVLWVDVLLDPLAKQIVVSMME